MAVAEKAVLHVSDLLDWIADPKEISWDRGLLGFCDADCQQETKAAAANGDSAAATPDNGSSGGGGSNGVISSIYYPGHTDFLADVRYAHLSMAE